LGASDTATTPKYNHREDGSTMKALRWHGNMDVRVEEAAIPDITEAQDVVIKVTGTTICGSDLHLLHSEMPGLQSGDILGHEFMGLVDRVGPEVTKLAVGDRVVVSFQIACGTCRYCKVKESSMCERTNNSSLVRKMWGQADACFLGYGHLAGGFPGGQSEYVRVPFGDVNCMKIPEGVADEQALWLSDIYPTAYQAVDYTGVKEGDVVGVWGLGPVGVCVVQFALIRGAKKVYVIDKVAARLDMAKSLDPSRVECIDFSKQDVTKTLQESTQNELLDVAIDSTTFHEPKSWLHTIEKALMLETDAIDTPNEMIFNTRKLGKCGLIGVYSGYANHFNIGALMNRGISLIGCGQAPVHKHWEMLMEWIKEGKLDARHIVSHRVALDDFSELYKAFDKRVAGVQKVFVQTSASSAPSPGFPQLTKVSDWMTEQL